VARVAGSAGAEASPVYISPFDDDLRYRIPRTIYSNAAFWLRCVNPPPSTSSSRTGA
jgi:hypothetical protein